MGNQSIADLRDIALEFDLGREFDSAERYGSGHINDTYLVSTTHGAAAVRFVLQRINRSVFKDPAALMDNVGRVTEHLQTKITEADTCLTLVPKLDGACFHVDESGDYWRVYRFLESTRSFDSIPSAAHARAAAAEFGRFQNLLHNLPGPRLQETIPDFHNTPSRYVQFHEARARDAHDRARQCRREIDRALTHEECAGSLRALQDTGVIPERITHNDAKINNVMFHLDSDKAMCVIDLDTVMPGLALYDFGDMVRTATMPVAEDETDLSRITMRMDYYEALVGGYLSTAGKFLNETEVGNLSLACKLHQ